MNILVVAAETAPYAKVGGLADMAGSLPRAWHAAGHSACIVLPLYGTIDVESYGIVRTDHIIAVPMGTWTEFAEIWHGTLPDCDVPVYFVKSTEYYDRPGIYGYHDGFPDNDRRFIFLSRASFELARAIGFRPDIVHAHDYHTAPCMPMLAIHYRNDAFFAQTAGVFTIHNMAYQGMYDPQRAMEFCGFDVTSFHTGSWFEHDGAFNCLKAGMMFADKITTVSPTYAEEIRWTSEGMGLQGALQARGADVLGVLNGIDLDEWNPERDPHLPVPYTYDTIAKKDVVKRSLLKSFGCSDDVISHDLPLVGMVTRLTDQKGISLVCDVLEGFIATDRLRFVVLGSGDNRYEQYFRQLSTRYPQHVFVGTGYNHPLSHRIQGASDFYLMPSRFEPCGLTQMFAMRYGTIPIVRAVGGLADTVEQYDPISLTGTGIRFDRFSAQDCASALEQALKLYRREPHWSAIRRSAMSRDFGIGRTADHYISVFSWALERHR